jgi:hypothetical protein
MKAPMAGILFQLYIVVEDAIIGAVLTQVTEGKEHIITYFNWRLVDVETRYSFIKKLCLSLFYACSKLRYYLLSSTCVVACQADAIRHILQQPILSGRIRKWAYGLMSYPVFMPKACTHRMHDPGSIVPHIRSKVFIDNQIS